MSPKRETPAARSALLAYAQELERHVEDVRAVLEKRKGVAALAARRARLDKLAAALEERP